MTLLSRLRLDSSVLIVYVSAGFVFASVLTLLLPVLALPSRLIVPTLLSRLIVLTLVVSATLSRLTRLPDSVLDFSSRHSRTRPTLNANADLSSASRRPVVLKVTVVSDTLSVLRAHADLSSSTQCDRISLRLNVLVTHLRSINTMTAVARSLLSLVTSVLSQLGHRRPAPWSLPFQRLVRHTINSLTTFHSTIWLPSAQLHDCCLPNSLRHLLLQHSYVPAYVFTVARSLYSPFLTLPFVS